MVKTSQAHYNHDTMLQGIIEKAMTYVEHDPVQCLALADKLQLSAVPEVTLITLQAWRRWLRGVAQARRTPQVAKPLLQRARAYAKRHNDHLLYCLSLAYLGAIAGDAGEPQQSIKFTHEVLRVGKQHGYTERYPILLARLYSNMALSYVHFSMYEKALDYNLCVFELYQQHYPELMYRSLGNLALTQQHLGYTTKAERSYTDAIEASAQAQDTLALIMFRINLALMYVEQEMPDKAIQVCLQARAIMRETGSYNYLVTDILVILADAYTQKARFDEALLDKALGYYKKASMALKKYPSSVNELELCYRLGKHYWQRGQQHDARKIFDHTLTLATKLRREDSQQQIHEALATLHEQEGDFQVAYHHLRQCHTLRKALFEADVQANTKSLLFTQELKEAQLERDIVTRKNKELEQLNQRLAKANRKLKVASVTDALTKLYNRRYLEKRLQQEFQHACDQNLDISVIICDLDRFKQVNDTFSHAVGDKVLQHLAKLLEKTVRIYDTVARYGGEEFVILLPNTNLEQAMEVAEKIRLATFDYPWRRIHHDLMITVSAGVASGTEYGTGDKLLDAADKQLYAAKSNGRNCVVSILTLASSSR